MKPLCKNTGKIYRNSTRQALEKRPALWHLLYLRAIYLEPKIRHIMRIDQRALDQLREVKITRNYTRYAEGSVLVEFGHTKVLCTASIDNSVPRF